MAECAEALRIEGLEALPESEEELRFAEIVRDLVCAGMKAKAARDSVSAHHRRHCARGRRDWHRFDNALKCIGDALHDMDITVIGLNADVATVVALAQEAS
ncbi:MAG TPA: hypothetical protein VHM01_07425 [Alphaproteobacteria bacterium]|nr:hypothetical protein [Alphaproteobacteria bacterium]